MAASSRITVLPQLAWKTSFKLIPIWFIFISLIGVAFGMILIPGIGADAAGFAPVRRVVETIVPLSTGMLAAMVFSPENEPVLEVILSCRRPAAWSLLERIGLCLAIEGSIALAANLVYLAAGNPGGEALLTAVARWAAPALFLSGAGVFVSLSTRQGVFGELMVLLMWGGMLLGGDALLQRYPFLWPVHVYLQPGAPRYLFNRLALIVVGIGLILLAAYQTRDEERMLGI